MTTITQAEADEIIEASRHIPEEIKKQVRQECNFGCAICGMPFFDYEHIVDFSKVKKHEAANIVLLCPNHHAGTTRKKLSKNRIQYAKDNPKNQGKFWTAKPHDVVDGLELGVNFGNCSASFEFPSGNGDHIVLRANGKNFLGVHCRDGLFSISCVLTDFLGGEVLVIHEGQLLLSTDITDYTYVGKNLIVKAGDITVIDMVLTDEKIHIKKGIMFHNREDGFLVDNGKLYIVIDGGESQGVMDGMHYARVPNGIGILNKKYAANEEGTPFPLGFFYYQSN